MLNCNVTQMWTIFVTIGATSIIYILNVFKILLFLIKSKQVQQESPVISPDNEQTIVS
jgi:hypothetical protein